MDAGLGDMGGQLGGASTLMESPGPVEVTWWPLWLSWYALPSTDFT